MSQFRSASVLLFVACSLSGCATMNWGGGAQEVEQAAPTSQCTIDIRAAGGKPKVSSYTLAEDSTVQQVLEGSGAGTKFSRLQVDLYRKTPQGQWHKMGVEYDRQKKRVDPIHDYHVRPGDRLVVTEDTTDMLDSMMSAASGGAIGGKKR